MASFSKATPTIRPKMDAPSFNLMTPTAYGASPAWRAGATRMIVKLARVPSPDRGTGCHAR